MALFNYFKCTEHVKSAGSSTLPDPTGPLSKVVPSSSIVEASKEVSTVQDAERTGKKRSPYMIFVVYYRQISTDR